MSAIQTQSLSLSYHEDTIIKNLDINIPEGKITALIGPNGSGKSTILKSLVRVLKPTNGHVFLDGKEIQTIPTKKVAQKLSFLPQSPDAPDGLTVEELVSYGRYPYQKGFGIQSKEDLEMISWAIRVTNLEEFVDRPINSLSGGQRQRAWIAMALAQGTDYMLLDEPTTYLDLAHQIEVLQLLEELNQLQKKTIIMVVHDLNHAARFSQYVIAISKGELAYEGSPKDVITKEMLSNVFGLEAEVILDPIHKMPLCIPYSLTKTKEPVAV
ncbi:ABC transporter ATP-binding protein [Desulfuribacillus alkaliarsenatis]|uniref:Iron-dicitrate transporter ATP-binding subunit n=1 Tax=Desulfuribacillus alkaliarsenatis TaxID=766136 RepID=A0A1E5G4M2_9FIRM|nr:ABC transporter ATP-binding protein [Desulfuribacillus alkaliarsenatis]OEF98128.1 iron-dicitrate transporter ATP-binding subunit [Desulfuribacillus alkaliarsenatis]